MTEMPGMGMSADDVIWGGGGAKSAEWPVMGSWVGGKIVGTPRTYHAKEYVPNNPGAGKPKFTKSGQPVMGVRIDVVTAERDPSVQHDDGIRRMHLDKFRQLEALREAFRAAGVRHLAEGGELWVQWAGEEQGEGANPAKTWQAQYRPPQTQAAGQAQAGPAQAPPYTPAPQVPAYPNYYAGAGQAGPPAQPPVSAPQSAFPGLTQGAGPTWATGGAQPPAQPPAQPHQAVQYAPPPVHQEPASPPPMPRDIAAPNVITQTMEAAMKNAGVDTSAFTVVPG